LALIFWNLSAFAQPHVGQSHVTRSQFIPNRYTLLLSDPPVANRFRSRDALATAQADTYRRQIETAQAQVKSQLAARNFQVLGSVSVLQNAIFVAAPASRVAELRTIPGVIAVQPVRRMKLLLNRAVALANAAAAWTAVGGQSSAGAGIKIGVLDTGIDQTHPALQDSSLKTPAGFPICDAWTTSQNLCSQFTNSKVIVARSYMSLLTDFNPADSTPDDFSPRDHIGHGTANAVIAAGNTVTTPAASTNGGKIAVTGMAPKAWLGNYKVQGSPGVDEFGSDQTLMQAVEDAVHDGMDIITCSIGSPAYSDAASDPLAATFQSAAQFAVVVVAAGDSGAAGYQYPSFNTISSPSNAPDVISVGATTNSHVLLPTVSVNAAGAPSSVVGIGAAVGDSYFYPSSNGANAAPLIDVTTLGDNGLACSALPANSLTGKYALIQRGTCTFDTKAANAQTAGAIGFIFYMATSAVPVSPEGINENGPSVMISNAAGVALKSYIDANPGAMVTIDLNGMEEDVAAWSLEPCNDPTGGPCPSTANNPNIEWAVAANQLASYSSMGPTPDGQLKPDMVATGGLDPDLGYYYNPNDEYLPAPSGMYSATQNYDPNQPFYANLFSTNRYAAVDGSSFSAPLTAGAAALLKQAHPGLRPTQIKSLLVNYADQTVTTDDVGDTVDAEWIGAGLLDAGAAMSAPVTAEIKNADGTLHSAVISFGILNSAALPITKTITLTNISSGSVSLNASVSSLSVDSGTLSNTTVAVTPASVTLAAGGTATLTVTLSGSRPAVGEYSGNVVLQNSSTTLRIPFMLLEGNGTVYNVLPSVSGEGVPGEDVGPASVQLTDEFGVPVTGSSVTFSVSPRGSLTLESVAGEPACSPASSTSSVVCPTDQFGFAYAEVINGPAVSSPTVNYSGSGFNTVDTDSGGSYNIQAAPAITAASVVDAAAYQQPIAPGSYVNIYGTGLSSGTINANGDTNDATTDALSPNGTYTTYPLQMDYTTVTFDVPSAGISVPGRITFVCSQCLSGSSGSYDEVQIQVPWELAGQSSAQIKVVIDGDLFGNVVTVPLATYAPQFFTAPVGASGGTIAVAQDATTYALVCLTNCPAGVSPNSAKRGQTIIMYANGLGPVNNNPGSGVPPTGGSSTTQQPVTVSFGGQTVTPIFAGLADFPGLYQINVTVPQGVTPGNAVPVTITVGGVTSGQATLPVQ
jgi:uncharacterized protein (TIGR03437 family)